MGVFAGPIIVFALPHDGKALGIIKCDGGGVGNGHFKEGGGDAAIMKAAQSVTEQSTGNALSLVVCRGAANQDFRLVGGAMHRTAGDDLRLFGLR